MSEKFNGPLSAEEAAAFLRKVPFRNFVFDVDDTLYLRSDPYIRAYQKCFHSRIVNESSWPEGVDLFNLNVPSNYDSEEVKITHLSHKMLDKQVIDNTDEEKMEIFNYPLEDNQESDGLIMITPDLVKDYEEGSDGYALMVDKCPSLTPLKVNMTYDDLKNW